ncbi:MAG: HAD family hydrolase [Armatimonadota bacterium]
MNWAIIFDVDGVVADTETLNARASVMMFEELYDTTVQPEDFREFVGTGDERYVEGVAEKYDVQIDTEKAVERRRENFFKLQEKEPLPAMPGVMDIVETARVSADVMLAIATSGNRDKQFPVIEGAGLELAWFDVVVTGDDVTRKKPDPQIYEITAEKLGLPPERCVVLEDAPAGVASAKSASAVCVAVTSSVEAKKLRDADLVVDSLEKVSVAKMRRMV